MRLIPKSVCIIIYLLSYIYFGFTISIYSIFYHFDGHDRFIYFSILQQHAIKHSKSKIKKQILLILVIIAQSLTVIWVGSLKLPPPTIGIAPLKYLAASY